MRMNSSSRGGGGSGSSSEHHCELMITCSWAPMCLKHLGECQPENGFKKWFRRCHGAATRLRTSATMDDVNGTSAGTLERDTETWKVESEVKVRGETIAAD